MNAVAKKKIWPFAGIGVLILIAIFMSGSMSGNSPETAYEKVVKVTENNEWAYIYENIDNRSQYQEILTKGLNNSAKLDLTWAAVSQKAFYIENDKYSKNVNELMRKKYGLKLSEGVKLAILDANDDSYTMKSSHVKGDETYLLSRGGDIRVIDNIKLINVFYVTVYPTHLSTSNYQIYQD